VLESSLELLACAGPLLLPTAATNPSKRSTGVDEMPTSVSEVVGASQARGAEIARSSLPAALVLELAEDLEALLHFRCVQAPSPCTCWQCLWGL
jgi:hypothetical protein